MGSVPRPIPLASVVAAAAAASPVPPLAVWVRARRGQSDADALLKGCVDLSVDAHPVLRAKLDAAGVKGAAGTISPASAAEIAASLAPGCVAVLAETGRWRAARNTLELETALGIGDLSLPTGPRPAAARGSWLRMHRRGKNIHVELSAEGFNLAGRHVTVGQQLRLGVDEAAGVLDTVLNRVVVDGSSGAYSSLLRLAQTARTAAAVPGAPGLALLRDGLQPPTPVTALSAVRGLAEVDGRTPVGCHPFVADIAAITTQPSVPLDSRLREHQRRAVASYLSSRWGLLCALPPGSGKTVVAAAALNARHDRGASRAVVVAPAALRDQWHRELSLFYPKAKIHRCTTLTDLADPADSGPHVFIVSYELATSGVAELIAVGADDLIVDEASFLARQSKRSFALWQLRRSVPLTLLLTGTPEVRSVDDVGRLVSFVLGRESFSGAPLSKEHFAPWRERVGPLLFGDTDETAAGSLPALCRNVVAVTATDAELELLAQAASALDVARAQLSAAQSSTERRDARLAVANAASQLRAVTADASAASRNLAVTAAAVGAHGSKRAWLRSTLADQVPTVCCVSSAAAAEAVASDLSEHGIRAVPFTAATTPTLRTKAARALGNDVDCVIVATSSHQGWDLPNARRVVHLDVPASMAEELQRSSRARRMSSQTAAVEVVFLVFAGTVEHGAATRLLAELEAAEQSR